jgi:hypothetical protein
LFISVMVFLIQLAPIVPALGNTMALTTHAILAAFVGHPAHDLPFRSVWSAVGCGLGVIGGSEERTVIGW